MSDIDPPDSFDPPSPPPPPADGPTWQQSPDTYLPYSNWSYGNILVAILIGFVAASIALTVILQVGGSLQATEDVSTLALLPFQAGATLLLIAGLSRYRGTGSWRTDFGLEIKPRQAWGLVAGALIQVAVGFLLMPIVRLLGDDGPQQAIAQETAATNGWELVGIVFFVVLVAPVVEEIVYRGMLLGRLMKTVSKGKAVTISAAVFAVIHLADPNAILVVPGLFLVGVALGFLALRAGNLGLPIFAHMGVNGFGVLLLLYSDEIQDSVESAVALLL